MVHQLNTAYNACHFRSSTISIVQETFELPQKIYDLVFPRNLLTGKREFQFFPIKWFLQSVSCNCDKTISNRYSESKFQNTVDRVAHRLLQKSPRKDLCFSILNIKRSNAYSCPHGGIFITEGMLEELKSFHQSRLLKYCNVKFEDLVAVILGHEVSHYNGLHTQNKMQNKLFLFSTIIVVYELALSLLNVSVLEPLLTIFIPSFLEYDLVFSSLIFMFYLIGSISTLGISVSVISVFSLLVLLYIGHKSHEDLSQFYELQADEYGMRLAKKAGYNPKAFLLWTEKENRIESILHKRKDFPNDLFSRLKKHISKAWGEIATHPDWSTRLEHSERVFREMYSNIKV